MKSILILTVVIAVTGIIIALIASAIDSDRRSSQSPITNNNSEYFNENIDYTYSNQTPKIGAQVNENLYKEIQSYCQKHSMTVSDLIRISVKSYMDRN